MVRARTLSLTAAALLTFACTAGQPPAPPPAPPADERVKTLADAYLDGFFARNPDQITLYGVPGRRHDKLPDNSLNALRAWQAREDALAEGARADRAGHDRQRVVARHAGHPARDPRRVDCRARLPHRAVDRQPVRQWLAGAGWLPRDHSACRQRRGAEGRALPVEHAAGVHRYRDRESARGAEGRLLGAERQCPPRRSSR